MGNQMGGDCSGDQRRLFQWYSWNCRMVYPHWGPPSYYGLQALPHPRPSHWPLPLPVWTLRVLRALCASSVPLRTFTHCHYPSSDLAVMGIAQWCKHSTLVNAYPLAGMSHYNLVGACQELCSVLLSSRHFITYVKGHADKTQENEDLTEPEFFNELHDKLAKRLLGHRV